MKSILYLLIALLLALPGALSAQTTTRPKPAAAPAPLDEAKLTAQATALTTNMQKGLVLNPQQVEKVQKINLNSMRSVETARAQYRQDLRKMSGVVDGISQSRLAALKEVLTAEQFNRYQRKREEKMGVAGGAAGQGTPVPGLPGGGE